MQVAASAEAAGVLEPGGLDDLDDALDVRHGDVK